MICGVKRNKNKCLEAPCHTVQLVSWDTVLFLFLSFLLSCHGFVLSIFLDTRKKKKKHVKIGKSSGTKVCVNMRVFPH